MSHFAIIVATDQPEGDELEKALAPYHEFECTGVNDEYIQDIDRTQEYREDYDIATELVYVSPEGEEVEAYDDRFYREPSEAELQTIGPIGGTGWGGGIQWTSKDWSDGKGYSLRVHFIPEGWTELRKNVSDHTTFEDYLKSDDIPIIDLDAGEEIDKADRCKYSYATKQIVNGIAEIKVYRRTNPHKKWDWWVVGGRWSNSLRLKSGETVDRARKSDIDYEAIAKENTEHYQGVYDKYDAALVAAGLERSWHTWEHCREVLHKGDIDAARAFYKTQPAIQVMNAVPDSFFVQFDDLLVSKEDYVAKKVRTAGAFHAIVIDGKWHQGAEMGWFGVTHNEQDDWPEQYAKLLADVRDDQWLTVVDCHI